MLDYADRPIKLPIEWTAGAPGDGEGDGGSRGDEGGGGGGGGRNDGDGGDDKNYEDGGDDDEIWGSISRRLLSLANSFFAHNRPVVLLSGTQSRIQPSLKQ